MHCLLCSEPLNLKAFDPDYQFEADSAKENNVPLVKFDFEEYVHFNNIDKACKLIKKQDQMTDLVYRGWMLTVEKYEELYNHLLNKNYKLINSPEEYKNGHWLPESYPIIEKLTAPSVYFPKQGKWDRDEIMKALSIFNGKPVILKDYVKSQKHHWETACFIEDSSNKDNVEAVLNEFLRLQQEVQGGLVFREFIELDQVGQHSKSKMPLSKEYRLVYFNHKRIAEIKYWDEKDYSLDLKDFSIFDETAKNIRSNFFTMDIAKTKASKWIIIEVGDGQVSDFRESVNVNWFYEKVKS